MHQDQLREYLQQMHERLWHIQHSPDTGLDDVIAIMRQMIAEMEETLRKLLEAEKRQSTVAHGPATEGAG